MFRSSLKGVQNRALAAYKNGRSASNFLLSGTGLEKASKKAISLSKAPSSRPLLKPDRVSSCTPKS